MMMRTRAETKATLVRSDMPFMIDTTAIIEKTGTTISATVWISTAP
ncbi:hypothetical protein GGE35_004108 [Rhizobium cellulosilyticum]|uniref:Uncharacterized protein n=1 Tax=Aliirhizobium cellulosilyticum TaxID=393664 RepID=A0A7W6V1K2_9HYPH|nr:hypothetical protein [Rhizobium cellulosilyticum]MBB4448271.1 hypothetical protein [Rhizobium cellulosilyticum]